MCSAALAIILHIGGTFYQKWTKQFATFNFLSFTNVLAELLQSILLLGLDEYVK